MEIQSFGVGGRMQECLRRLRLGLASAGGRLILLPIPTTRDNKYISGTDVALSSVTTLITEDCAVVGYNLPQKVREWAESVGARIFDAAFDEEFLLENARLTANGTLGYVLTEFDRDVADLSFGVVGYGRIGREISRLLLLLGASVRVYTTRPSVALELGEAGVEAEVISPFTDFSSLDILINTAPARQIDEERLPPNIEIIDLASGSIFEPSGRLTKLPSIPDKMYPKSAGRLYAEAILRFIWEEKL